MVHPLKKISKKEEMEVPKKEEKKYMEEQKTSRFTRKMYTPQREETVGVGIVHRSGSWLGDGLVRRLLCMGSVPHPHPPKTPLHPRRRRSACTLFSCTTAFACWVVSQEHSRWRASLITSTGCLPRWAHCTVGLLHELSRSGINPAFGSQLFTSALSLLPNNEHSTRVCILTTKLKYRRGYGHRIPSSSQKPRDSRPERFMQVSDVGRGELIAP